MFLALFHTNWPSFANRVYPSLLSVLLVFSIFASSSCCSLPFPLLSSFFCPSFRFCWLFFYFLSVFLFLFFLPSLFFLIFFFLFFFPSSVRLFCFFSILFSSVFIRHYECLSIFAVFPFPSLSDFVRLSSSSSGAVGPTRRWPPKLYPSKISSKNQSSPDWWALWTGVY